MIFMQHCIKIELTIKKEIPPHLKYINRIESKLSQKFSLKFVINFTKSINETLNIFKAQLLCIL